MFLMLLCRQDHVEQSLCLVCSESNAFVTCRRPCKTVHLISSMPLMFFLFSWKAEQSRNTSHQYAVSTFVIYRKTMQSRMACFCYSLCDFVSNERICFCWKAVWNSTVVEHIFSSVSISAQDGIIALRKAHNPPCLSAVSARLPLKQSLCLSG